ncbi:hypothetical protein POTOM_040955 [Populus tomentosa]|uniref:Trichome birefringence-like C-terminal domain-containing protein n=1 Tax=Populus tomentosa TaxID=118781 RepID=A0A8X7Z1P0_POPTO|nr:hypothetical protein POTOM_040955 [Populus tomentosa]
MADMILSAEIGGGSLIYAKLPRFDPQKLLGIFIGDSVKKGVRNGGLEVMKTASMDLAQLKVRPYWGTGSRLQIMKIVDNVLKISITQLSEYRYDGHTTIYGESKGKLLTKEQRSDPRKIADCIHWLLPGVLDT